MNVKECYEKLLEGGDLLALFPQMTGDWETDRKDFTEAYISIKEIENILLYFSDDDDEK